MRLVFLPFNFVVCYFFVTFFSIVFDGVGCFLVPFPHQTRNISKPLQSFRNICDWSAATWSKSTRFRFKSITYPQLTFVNIRKNLTGNCDFSSGKCRKLAGPKHTTTKWNDEKVYGACILIAEAQNAPVTQLNHNYEGRDGNVVFMVRPLVIAMVSMRRVE